MLGKAFGEEARKEHYNGENCLMISFVFCHLQQMSSDFKRTTWRDETFIFWITAILVVVIIHRSVRTTCLSHKNSPLTMGPIGWTETSDRNYPFSLRYNAEKRSSVPPNIIPNTKLNKNGRAGHVDCMGQKLNTPRWGLWRGNCRKQKTWLTTMQMGI